MELAKCTNKKCKLCFRDLYKTKSEKEIESAKPSFMRTTVASRSRTLSTLRELQSPAKTATTALAGTAPTPLNKSTAIQTTPLKANIPQPRSILLRLPRELRERIYDLVIWDPTATRHEDTPPNEADGIVIWGSVYGGGNHIKKTEKFPTGVWINGSRGFSTEILLLDKQIYAEASAYVYKRIAFDLYAKNDRQGERLRYWLRQHPLRFTRELSFYFSLDLSGTGPESEPAFARPLKHDSDLKELASHVRAMPNLQKFVIQLIPTGSEYRTYDENGAVKRMVSFAELKPGAMKRCLRPLSWFKRENQENASDPFGLLERKPVDYTVEILLSSVYRYDRREYTWPLPEHLATVLTEFEVKVQRIYVEDDTKYFSVEGATWELNPGRRSVRY
jgi:hypothetical protein